MRNIGALVFLLFCFGVASAMADDGDVSYEKMGDTELSQRSASLVEKAKVAEVRAEAYGDIKVSIESTIGRIGLVTYPTEITGPIADLRKKLSGDKLVSPQSIQNELSNLFFQFSNKLTSVAPNIFSFGLQNSTSSVKSDLTRELFSDIGTIDSIFYNPYLGFSTEEKLSDETKKDMIAKLDSLSEQSFNDVKVKLKDYLTKKLTDVQSLLTTQQTADETYKKQLGLIYSAIDKKKKAQSKIDEALVTYGIPAIALTMIVLLVTPILYRKDKSQEYILNSGLLIQIFTIFLLTSTILVLGFAGKIDSNSLGTLLGGISGFVLGRNSSSTANKSGEN